jgi:hypothetical protein
MVFTPVGSNITYRRDFLVSDTFDTVADFIIGAKFMAEQWPVLFKKMTKRIAGWFRHKKETPGTHDDFAASKSPLSFDLKHELTRSSCRRESRSSDLESNSRT